MTGYNRSTFYQYFKDTYDLRDYLEDDVLSFIIAEREAALPLFEETDWLQHVTEIDVNWLQHIAHIFEEKQDYLAVLLGDFGSNRFTDRLKGELPSPLPNKTPLDQESAKIYFVREALFSAAVATFRSWAKNPNYLTADELATLIYDLFIHGLNSETGKNILAYL